MGNNVVPAGKTGAIAVYQGHDNPWADVGREVESNGSFLNFNGNTGELSFGKDDTNLPEGSAVVADMINMEMGWICWKDGSPVEEIMVPILSGKPPLEHELTDHGPYDDADDGWREALSIPMIVECAGTDPDHEIVGSKLLFKTSTGGAVRSAKKLSGAFGKLFREHSGELPVVEITTEAYTPREKKFGKKHAILFKIIGWMDETGLAELAGLLADEDGEYLPEDTSAADAAAAAKEAERAAAAEVLAKAKAAAAAAEAAALAEEAANLAEAAEAAHADDEPAAPPMRRTRTATAAAEAAPAQAPARRRTATATATAAAAEPAMEAAPEPRGRSEERGGRRTRRFAQ